MNAICEQQSIYSSWFIIASSNMLYKLITIHFWIRKTKNGHFRMHSCSFRNKWNKVKIYGVIFKNGRLRKTVLMHQGIVLHYKTSEVCRCIKAWNEFFPKDPCNWLVPSAAIPICELLSFVTETYKRDTNSLRTLFIN